jgi:hypothetical protein
LQGELSCGLSYTLCLPTPTQTLRTTAHLWTVLTAPGRSVLRLYAAPAAQSSCLKEAGVVEVGGRVRTLLYVPEEGAGGGEGGHQVWAAMEGERSILVYAAR